MPNFSVPCNIEGCLSSYGTVIALKRHTEFKHKRGPIDEKMLEPVLEETSFDEEIEEEQSSDRLFHILHDTKDPISCSCCAWVVWEKNATNDAAAYMMTIFEEEVKKCKTDTMKIVRSNGSEMEIK